MVFCHALFCDPELGDISIYLTNSHTKHVITEFEKLKTYRLERSLIAYVCVHNSFRNIFGWFIFKW
jgi:hypothetical protein